MEILSTKEAVQKLNHAVMAGRKVPHRVSHPVLRFDGTGYRLALFVFFFTFEEIRAARIGRPAQWAVADLQSGELLEVYDCKERDFSSASFEEKYDIREDAAPNTPPEYYEETCALLDSVRKTLLTEGRVDWETYGQYLERILRTIPASYQRFYNELSVQEEEQKGEQTMEPENLPPEQPVPPVDGEPVPETPPAEPAEGAAASREMLDKLEGLRQAVAALQEGFDSKIAEDAHKNKLFDAMHRELVGYQNGAMDKIVDTMALDIIQLIDTTSGHISVYEQKEPSEESYKKLLRVVKGVAEDLLDILYRQSIEAYSVEGDEVDVRRQKIIQTLPTDDPAKDNRVAARAASGYEKDGKILRPERVKIFKYDPLAAGVADQ